MWKYFTFLFWWLDGPSSILLWIRIRIMIIIMITPLHQCSFCYPRNDWWKEWSAFMIQYDCPEVVGKLACFNKSFPQSEIRYCFCNNSMSDLKKCSYSKFYKVFNFIVWIIFFKTATFFIVFLICFVFALLCKTDISNRTVMVFILSQTKNLTESCFKPYRITNHRLYELVTYNL